MGNIFQQVPEHLEQEIFEQIQAGEHVTIERIISKGHSSPASGWYDQARNEWVLLLRGEAELSFPDGETIRLTAGDYVSIPAHTRHRVDWTDPHTETIWLAVHY